jgi:hypothetical protein
VSLQVGQVRPPAQQPVTLPDRDRQPQPEPTLRLVELRFGAPVVRSERLAPGRRVPPDEQPGVRTPDHPDRRVGDRVVHGDLLIEGGCHGGHRVTSLRRAAVLIAVDHHRPVP